MVGKKQGKGLFRNPHTPPRNVASNKSTRRSTQKPPISTDGNPKIPASPPGRFPPAHLYCPKEFRLLPPRPLRSLDDTRSRFHSRRSLGHRRSAQPRRRIPLERPRPHLRLRP